MIARTQRQSGGSIKALPYSGNAGIADEQAKHHRDKYFLLRSFASSGHLTIVSSFSSLAFWLNSARGRSSEVTWFISIGGQANDVQQTEGVCVHVWSLHTHGMHSLLSSTVLFPGVGISVDQMKEVLGRTDRGWKRERASVIFFIFIIFFQPLCSEKWQGYISSGNASSLACSDEKVEGWDRKAGQKGEVVLRSLVIFSSRQWTYSDLLYHSHLS